MPPETRSQSKVNEEYGIPYIEMQRIRQHHDYASMFNRNIMHDKITRDIIRMHKKMCSKKTTQEMAVIMEKHRKEGTPLSREERSRYTENIWWGYNETLKPIMERKLKNISSRDIGIEINVVRAKSIRQVYQILIRNWNTMLDSSQKFWLAHYHSASGIIFQHNSYCAEENVPTEKAIHFTESNRILEKYIEMYDEKRASVVKYMPKRMPLELVDVVASYVFIPKNFFAVGHGCPIPLRVPVRLTDRERDSDSDVSQTLSQTEEVSVDDI